MNKAKLNILIAYPYFKREMVDYLAKIPRDSYRLIVDSGAFTAWNTGKKIGLDDYCAFLDSISHLRPFNAVQLDVFGDPEGSFKNLGIMQERGYDVMPVFTRGETLERLDQYYEKTDYIMFGGIVIGDKNKNYVKWFLNRNKGRKCHWLGFVQMEFIKHYKPESVDSSSWMAAARFGFVDFYNGCGDLSQYRKDDFAGAQKAEIVRAAARTGISPGELLNLRRPDAWKFTGRIPDFKTDFTSAAQYYSTISHVFRSIEVEKYLGTKIYLAISQPQFLYMVFAARDHLASKKLINYP